MDEEERINVEPDDEAPLLGSKKASSSLTSWLLFSMLVAVCGGSFQFGWNTGVINAPSATIKEFYNETYHARYNVSMPAGELTLLWSVTVSVFPAGGIVGGSVSGVLADSLGRKGSMLVNNVLALVAAGCMGVSKYLASYEMIIVGRLLIGITCAISCALVPMYLTEISPLAIRGACGVIHQLLIVCAILLADVFGMSEIMGSSDMWPILLALTAFPAVFQLLLLPFCPESPRYLLVAKGQRAKAAAALNKLRGTHDIDGELNEIMREFEEMQREPTVRWVDLVGQRQLRVPLVIALVIQMSQQLSGINAVTYYSNDIFGSAKFSPSHSTYATIGVGGVNLLMTVISIPLMDRLGRRTLHLAGLIGMTVFSVLLSLSLLFQDSVSWFPYLSISGVVLFVVFFSIGPGSIPWFIMTEMIPMSARGKAVSLAVLTNFFCNFLVGLLFPILQESLGYYSFLVFASLLAVFSVFTYLKMPETKNKTVDQVLAVVLGTPQ